MKDDIIRMAREAGFADGVAEIVGLEGFARFAALVAKHTLANIDPSSFMSWQEGYAAGTAAEREACAKLCEQEGLLWGRRYAVAIRARGQA